MLAPECNCYIHSFECIEVLKKICMCIVFIMNVIDLNHLTTDEIENKSVILFRIKVSK